jgi:hypothetical protein
MGFALQVNDGVYIFPFLMLVGIFLLSTKEKRKH